MPVPTNQIPPTSVTSFVTAASVPLDVRKAMQASAATMNTIEPQLLASLKKEREGQCWIVARGEGKRIEMVISCTENDMGRYPIFIAPTISSSQLSSKFLYSRISPMIEALREIVPDKRVYSVFGPSSASNVFTSLWGQATDIVSCPEPYYDSFLSICTRSSFSDDKDPLDGRFEYKLEQGKVDDIPQIKQLCYEFAQDSAPFDLTHERALREARLLVEGNQVFVLRLTPRDGCGKEGIACIVAVTRTSSTNATITKVYTNPDYRKMGCAKRLVRHVTGYYLNTEKKDSVSLYVGRKKPAAIRVYHCVGFGGLDTTPNAEKADNWTEIGFDIRKVELGHW